MRPTKGDSLLVAVGAAVSGLGGFAFTTVLARTLGPAGTGVVMTVTTWFTVMLSLGKFGLDTTLVREGGRIRAGEPGANARQLLRWTLAPTVLGSAILGAAIALASGPLGRIIMPDSPVDLGPLVAASGLLLPLGVFTVVFLALVRGLGSIVWFISIEQLFKPSARLAIALVLAAAAVTAPTAYGVAWLLPVALGAGVALGLLLVAGRNWPSSEAGPASERQRIWAFARPRAYSQAVDILNTSLGTIVLAVQSTPAQTGAFATALRVVLAGQLVFQAVRLLLAPSLAALLASGRVKDAESVFASGSALIVMLAWPAFLICLILPDLVLGLFGAQFESAATSLAILSLSGLVLAVVGNQGSVVLMSGRSREALGAVAAGTLFNAGLTVALVADWGADAAALGWTVGVCVEGLLLARVLRGMHIKPLPRPALAMAGRVCLVLVPALVAIRLLDPATTTTLATLFLALLVTALLVRAPGLSNLRTMTSKDGGSQ